METRTLTEAGLMLLYEAAVLFLFNATNRPTERFRLSRELGMSDGFWLEVLNECDKVHRVHATSAKWMLTDREHERRLADMRAT